METSSVEKIKALYQNVLGREMVEAKQGDPKRC